MEQVGIVIPVYNEGANIEIALARIFQEVQVPYKVYIVYDFDDDNTLAPAQLVAKRFDKDIILLKNKFGRGALNAIKTGLRFVSGEFVVVTMADLSDPPRVINEMVRLAVEKNCDLVCGSRYMRGGSQIGGPLLKRTLSRIAGKSLHFLTGIQTQDCTNSFKLYKKTMLEQLSIESSGGFEIGLELVVKAFAADFKIGEVPTSWVDRSEGQSRFRLFAWLPKYLKWYLYAIKYTLCRGFRKKKVDRI